MKNTMIFGLAVGMIATSMAVAAPMKAAKAPGKKVAAVAKAKAAPAKAAVVAASAPVVAAPVAAPAPVVAAPSAQSTATVAAATQEVKKSKFGMLLVDRASFATASSNRSETTQADALLTVRPSYKVTDSTSVAAGIDIGHSFGADEDKDAPGVSKAKWVPYDAYLMVSKSSLGTLPGDIKAKGNARFYLPTSEDSQDAGQIGALRTNLTLSKALGKATVRYSIDPRYYFQQYNTYIPAGKSAHQGTNDYRITHYVELAVQATEKLNLYTDLGIDHRYYHGDDSFKVATARRDDLIAETGIEYAVNDNLGLILGVEQLGPDLRNPSKNNEANAVYRDDKSSWFVEADVTF